MYCLSDRTWSWILAVCIIWTACSERESIFIPEAPAGIEIDMPSPLGMINYLGNIQNIHPKVIYFSEPWCGYRWWMAYTPYPKGDIRAENPCICVSEDGLSWEAPAGLSNPLVPSPSTGYNSDTHLVYNPVNDTMECWWRDVNTSTCNDRFLRVVSSDGVTWTDPEIVHNPQTGLFHLSPAISVVDGAYYMLYCDAQHVIMRRSLAVAPDIEWTSPTSLPIEWGSLRPWHLDMTVNPDGTIEMVVCAFAEGGNNNSADLYYIIYDPTTGTATLPELILARSENTQYITNRSIYRSSLVKNESGYWLYYSCIDRYWNRYIGLARGLTLQSLKFISSDVNGQ